MSVMVSFVLSFFPRGVLDEILNLMRSVSEGFPSYSSTNNSGNFKFTVLYQGLKFHFILSIIFETRGPKGSEPLT